MTNPRVRRIADRVKVVVAEMLERRIKDPRLGFVTVTDVRLTGDSQQATIFYTVLGDDADLTSTAAALESAKGLIRSEVGKQLGTRQVPTLTFVADALPESARALDEVLARARELDEQVAAGAWHGVRGRGRPLQEATRGGATELEDDDPSVAGGPVVAAGFGDQSDDAVHDGAHDGADDLDEPDGEDD